MNLQVEQVGAGPDLALIHGWGMHAGVWEGVRTGLAFRFRLHLVDLPGYGASPDLVEYDLTSLARAVASALPERVHVCGWSLGGQVALEMARLFPAQIGRLVLTATTPRFTVAEDWPWAVEVAVLQEFAAALEADYEGTLKRFLALQVRGDDEARAVLKRLRDLLFARGRPSVTSLRAGLQILLGSDLRSQAAAVQAPTLVLHGERDLLTPPGAARWLSRQIPSCRLEIQPGAAHAPFLSHPGEFVETLSEFLA